ncbi:winged helix-turn-helix transcriptional regulator [Streptomyces sp. MUM 16J]|nr:winged helix-turn-helix transcriptional regulator [Streptomyces sp. MUM 16J]
MFASPVRLHAVGVLIEGESVVTGLAEQVGGALPAVSQHLTQPRLAGLVHSRRESRRQVHFVAGAARAVVIDVVRLRRAARRADGCRPASGVPLPGLLSPSRYLRKTCGA